MTGFFKAWRDILDTDSPTAWFPKDPKTAHVYMQLVNQARWIDATIPLPRQKTPLKAGQCVIGSHSLAKATGFGREAIRRSLDVLRVQGKINQVSNQVGTIVTINDYEELFGISKELQPTEKPSGNQAATNRQPHQEKERKREGEKDDHAVSSIEPADLGLGLREEPDPKASPAEQAGMTHPSSARPLPSPRALAAVWNEECRGGMQRVKIELLTPEKPRYRMAMVRLRSNPDLEYWRGLMRRAAMSPFLRGEVLDRHGKPYQAGFDWFLRPDTEAKIAEGTYDPKGPRLVHPPKL